MWDTLKRQMEWRAVPVAGLVAGTVYLLWVAVFAPTLGLTLSIFLQYNASLLLGSGAVTEPDTGTWLVGLIVFYVLSLLFALLIAVVIHRWGLWVGILGGALLGLCLYAINYYSITLLFPWMFALNTPLLIVGHLVFGAVAGGVYETLDHYDRPVLAEERP